LLQNNGCCAETSTVTRAFAEQKQGKSLCPDDRKIAIETPTVFMFQHKLLNHQSLQEGLFWL